MDCIATRIPYRQTQVFSNIILDYLDQSNALKTFFSHPPTISGLKQAIDARKHFATNRQALVDALKMNYDNLEASAAVKLNIEALLSKDTFTITTAHQNNIFTGPLYFIYKILHTIKLADQCKTLFEGYNFVPVFYMGTEDADLEELNHIYVNGEKLTWNTKQTGAVGRMRIDKELLPLVDKVEGQLAVLPFGKEVIALVRAHYRIGDDLQTATFRFVNALFGELGLIILLPDNKELKKQMIPVFEDDLLHQTASSTIEETIEKLDNAGYKVQANPRDINLFYLKDELRERIEKKNDRYAVHNSSLSFTAQELLSELKQHPERFSPNVILRGLYQETILPNIAFIGGGGESAYWLELKDLFGHYKVPFPVLVLRNSFLIVENKWQEKIAKLGFTIEDFFLPEQELLNRLVVKESKHSTKLNGSLSALEHLYDDFKKQAKAVDTTLEKHVDALKLQTVHRLQELEKKMLRAERRKYTDQQRQIHTIKSSIFPGDGLQERKENFSYYYAKWGKEFIQKLYEHSLGLEQEFVILAEK